MGRGGGDGLKKVEEVTDGLNNMCTVVGDIMFFVARVAGYGGARCVVKNLVTC
jgi:hypothetical protein